MSFECDRWSPYKHGITQSFLHTWLRCREQARLKYLEGWRKKGVDRTDAREYGHVCHYVASECDSADQVVDAVGEYESMWNAKYPQAPEKDRQAQEIVYAAAEQVMQVYYDYYPDRSKDWVGREIAFRIPVTLPDGRCPRLVGKIDGAFVLGKRQDVWLKEIKTKSQININQTRLLVPMDLQCNMYLFALRKHLRQIKPDKRNFKSVNPKGVLYDIIRRPTKPKKTETLLDYRDRVRADAEKRPDFYFQDHEEPFTKAKVDAYYESCIMPVLTEVCDWYEGKAKHYVNPDGLVTMYGLSDLAAMITTGNTTGWHQVDDINEELTSPM